MIDTLNMAIHKQGGVSPFDVARYIDVASEGVFAPSGEQYIIGSIGNYRVFVNKGGVRLTGSVAKLVQGGENVSSPSRAAVSEGVGWLSDALHLNVGSAAVSRVDVARTFALSAEPSAYIGELQSREGMARAEINTNTLYLHSPSRWLCFYDKRAETHSRGQKIPPAWAKYGHLLRYEMRLTSNIGRQVGIRQVRVSDITQPTTWARLVNLWAEEYRNVVKASASTIKEATTARGVLDAIFADMLLRYAPTGYLSDVLRLTYKESGGRLPKQERSRLKQAIEKRIADNSTELIHQLNNAVEMTRTEAVNN